MRVILSWHKQRLFYSISSLFFLFPSLSFFLSYVLMRTWKEKDARTCLHKNQTKDLGNCLTTVGRRYSCKVCRGKRGDSVPCIRGLMRGDLPDQRVRKAAPNKAPSDSACQRDSGAQGAASQTGAPSLMGNPAKTVLGTEVEASST